MLVLKQSFPDGFSLHKARRFTEEEKPHYAEWFREQGFISLETTPLPHISWDDVSHRDPDGSFLGDSNRAWIVSDEEAQNYLSLNGQRAIAKEQKDSITEAASHAAELEKQYEATKAQFVSWTCTPIHEKNGEKECTHTFAFPDETLSFAERDVFDVGRVVNPVGFSAIPHNDNWETFTADRGWCVLRPMTENEEKCVSAILKFGNLRSMTHD